MAGINEIKTGVLVIGGGMAGLFAAIKAREEKVEVILVDKNYVSRSGSTAYAEGDYSVFNPEWGLLHLPGKSHGDEHGKRVLQKCTRGHGACRPSLL